MNCMQTFGEDREEKVNIKKIILLGVALFVLIVMLPVWMRGCNQNNGHHHDCHR